MHPVPESPTVPCPTCGASLPVDPSRDFVVCAYCARRVTVSADVIEPARVHAQQLERARDALITVRDSAAKQRWDAAVQRSQGWVWGASFALTMVIAVALGVSGIDAPWAYILAATPVFLAFAWGFAGSALRRRVRAGTLPDHAVVITIDDGWRSTATHMAPILHELRLPATLYLSTWYVEHQAIVVNVAVNFAIDRAAARWLDLGDILPGFAQPLLLGDPASRTALALRINQAIDAVPGLDARVALAHRVAERAGVALKPFDQQFRFMTPEQLRKVHENGLAIELHGHRHQSVDMPGIDLAREIADNRAALLRAGITTPARHFCYPRGDLVPGIDVQLARHHVLSATTTRRALNPPGTPPHRLARLLDSPRISQFAFEAWLAGLYQPFDQLRR